MKKGCEVMTDLIPNLDPNAILAALMGTFLIVLIVFLVVMLFIETLFLKIGLNKVDGSKTEFGPVFLTVILMGLVNIIPCLGLFLGWWVISARHETSYGKAILAWLIAFLLALLVNLVFGVIIYFAGLIPSDLLTMFSA